MRRAIALFTLSCSMLPLATVRADVFTESRALRLASAPSSSLPRYPLISISARDFRRVHRHRLDAHGGIERFYSNGPIERRGFRSTPVFTGTYCLAAWNDYVAHRDAESKAIVVAQAESLLRHAERSRGKLIWRYDFPQPAFGAASGWLSGMGQGMGAACLAGAYALSHDARFESAVRDAVNVLRAPDGNEGTSVPMGRGVFYEEMAGGGARPSHVLNGHVFAVAGLWLVSQLIPERDYGDAMRAGIAGARAAIDRYLRPGISLYDLRLRGPAHLGGYGLIHAVQMRWLASVSGDVHFYEVAMRLTEFERAFTRTVKASATLRGRSTDSLDGRGGFWASPDDKPAILDVTFPRPVSIDQVRLMSPKSDLTPLAVTVMAPNVRTSTDVRSRYVRVDIPRVRTDHIRIVVRPRPGRVAALGLLTFSNIEHRSMTPIPGDLDATGGWRNLHDGTPSEWHSEDASWLLVELGGERDAIRAQVCAGSRPSWSFSPDLQRWTRESAHLDRMPVPAGARYALIRWRGAGCMHELTGAATAAEVDPGPPRCAPVDTLVTDVVGKEGAC